MNPNAVEAASTEPSAGTTAQRHTLRTAVADGSHRTNGRGTGGTRILGAPHRLAVRIERRNGSNRRWPQR